MNYKFISTDKKEIRDELINLGFQQINDNSETYLFIYDNKIQFNENILKNISFTNKICF